MDFEQILVERRDTTAVVTLNSGKVNAMTSVLLREAKSALGDLTRDTSVRSLVLTGGASRFFSFGLDVPGLLTADRPRMEALLRDLNDVLKALFLFPRPVVAAVNGHAMAGGLLLAVTADHRIGAEGKFSLGLSEVNLALAAPAVSLRILTRRVGAAITQEAAMTGRIYDPTAAREAGILNEVVPPEAVLDRSLARAKELGAPSRGGTGPEQALSHRRCAG